MTVASATLAMLRSGFVPRQDPNVVLVRDGLDLDLTPADVAVGKAGPQLAALHSFALMSAMVYSDGEARSVHWRDSGAGFGWVRPDPPAEPMPRPRPAWRWRIGEVRYDVWLDGQPGQATKAAIVFRGTDKEELGDWWANFRWVSRFLWLSWDQYDQVRDNIGPIVDGIRERYGTNTKIVAVGHSLGGGLAQQAAYEDGRIDLVYAFNPSSVTGYYSVKPPQRRADNGKNLTIYRVFEHGEILAYLRWVMKHVYPVDVHARDPQIVEVRYALSSEHNMITLHGMEDFAYRLDQIASPVSAGEGVPRAASGEPARS